MYDIKMSASVNIRRLIFSHLTSAIFCHPLTFFYQYFVTGQKLLNEEIIVTPLSPILTANFSFFIQVDSF